MRRSRARSVLPGVPNVLSRRTALVGLLALPGCAWRGGVKGPPLNRVDDAFFWRIVEAARTTSPTARERLLAVDAALSKASRRELDAFDEALWAWFGALDRHDLWAAAETLMGGCSDDGFIDFRAWLLLQGRAAVLDVVRDPDVLAGWTMSEDPRLEGLLSVTATHRPGPPAPRGATALDTSTWPADRLQDFEWTEQDCERLFPRLSARARARWP